MTTAGEARSRPVLILGRCFGACIVGLTSVVFVISFVAIIYNGELQSFRAQGIGLALLGATAMAGSGAFLFSYRGTVCQPQDVTALLLSISAAGIAAGWTGAGGAGLFATVATLVAVASLLTGVAALLCGRFRLGYVARYIPYPVLGGFLAATGYLLLAGAIGMTLARPVTLGAAAGLLSPEALPRWLPWIAAGAALAAVNRRVAHPMALPLGILAVGAGFYLVLALAGLSLGDARAAGLLLGPFEGASFLHGIDPTFFAAADWGLIAAQAPTLLAVAGMALVGALLNASGLELTLERELDLDRELRAVGAANIAASAVGGMSGFHLLGETIFAARLGITGRLAGLSAAGGCAAVLLFGAGALSLLPVGLFAAVIAFLGADLLYQWLWLERRKLPGRDFAIVLLILFCAATIGFLIAIAVGLVAASVLFIMSYARLDVVRLRSTAASRRSLVERAPPNSAWLAHAGHGIAIYELSGYLFFGTAHALLTRLKAEVMHATPRIDRLVLDLHRIGGIDVSAHFTLARLAAICARQGTRLVVTGLTPDLRAQLRQLAGDGGLQGVDLAELLDAALAQIEEDLLAARPARAAPEEGGFLAQLTALHPNLDPHAHFDTVTIAAGETLIRQGAASCEIFIVLDGTLRAEVARADLGVQTVAHFGPGALVGEIAYYAEAPRTASVIAETPARLLRIIPLRLDTPDSRALAADLHRLVAAHLARRLSRTTELLIEAGL